MLTTHAEVGRMNYARSPFLSFSGPLVLLGMPSFAREFFFSQTVVLALE